MISSLNEGRQGSGGGIERQGRLDCAVNTKRIGKGKAAVSSLDTDLTTPPLVPAYCEMQYSTASSDTLPAAGSFSKEWEDVVVRRVWDIRCLEGNPKTATGGREVKDAPLMLAVIGVATRWDGLSQPVGTDYRNPLGRTIATRWDGLSQSVGTDYRNPLGHSFIEYLQNQAFSHVFRGVLYCGCYLYFVYCNIGERLKPRKELAGFGEGYRTS